MPPPNNRLLAGLPAEDYARLAARATPVTLARKGNAYRAGGPIEFVFFPGSGMMSAVVTMVSGETAEVATVGREGMLGAYAALGGARSAEEVYCQVAPCELLRVPAADFAAEVARGGPLRDAVHAYLRGAAAVSARLTACNALHGVAGRLARWLLMVRDRVGADQFPLTQEFLGVMLGTRRATVTVAAQGFLAAGLIRYRQGKVVILDGPGLERAACECYAAIRHALPTGHPAVPDPVA